MQHWQIQAPRSPARCPWCHDDVQGVEQLVACAVCGARHHDRCHAECGVCASCGASEALYPKAPKTPRASRASRGTRPPAGSRIFVRVSGETTTLSWDASSQGNWLLIALFAFFPPFAIWFAYRVLNEPRQSVMLTPDSITFTTPSPNQLSRVRKVIPLSALGAVKVQGVQGGYFVTLDHGVTRHVLVTGSLLPALKAPELEWLAQEIQDWKDAHA
ncbi:MAG: hypothetical protein KDD82_21120 [Planctomycetes bacterium]|nr:hypothetical protein [Planctomycetota bacterium]